jgi:hypothetical protein
MLSPRASRPDVPDGYGIAPADGGQGLLPWSWAEERLLGRHIWWLATTRANGAPHLMAIWAVWLGDGVAFSTDANSAKARNIARNPRVSLVPERGVQSVIIDGVAEPLDPARTDEFVASYKSVWSFDPSEMDSPVFLVRPTKAFGFIDEDDGFTQSATRWVFD